MATLAQQRTAIPETPTTLSLTDARRQIAARPTLFSLASQQRQIQAPTPQMRNTSGQMGPAVGLPQQPLSIGQQPVAGPVTPGQPPGGTDWAALRQEIGGFGPAPTLDEPTMARMRALESQKLGNLYRGQLSELGAAAASSGALYGGDVSQLAAGFAAQRGQQEAELGAKFGLAANQQQREDYYKQFDAARGLAAQREGQAFTAQEAELDRRVRAGEQLSNQEWQSLENARSRQQQTSERVGSQQFSAEESQKQRVFVTDENAKERLSQMALAEKQIEATRVNLQTQLDQAKSENSLDRIQQLTVQMNDLDQDDQRLRQQNDQFLTDFGLRRDVFERGKTEFDLTRGDQVGQFAQSLEQSGNLARMDDATRRYVAELQDRLSRDINAAAIDPSLLQTILSGGGQIADILSKLGVSSSDIGGILSKINPFGGTSTGATTNALERAKDAASAGTPGYSNLAATGIGLAGAAAGAALIAKAFEPGSGAGWDASAGQFIAGPIGAAFGAIVGFGKDGRQVAQDKFTAEFDNAYRQLESQGALNKPPSDPTSFWNPEQKMGAALAFQASVRQNALMGAGKVEISTPDWQRMERLGLAADVKTSNRNAFFAIDDPRLIAMMGKGAASDFFTFEYPGQYNDKLFADTQGSTSALIASNSLIVKDKVTGEPIDFNNRAQMEAIAARNMGSAVGPTGMGTPPVTTPPKQGGY